MSLLFDVTDQPLLTKLVHGGGLAAWGTSILLR
jgi:hypothetical protein